MVNDLTTCSWDDSKCRRIAFILMRTETRWIVHFHTQLDSLKTSQTY